MVFFHSFLYVYQRVILHFPMVFLWFSHFPIDFPRKMGVSQKKCCHPRVHLGRQKSMPRRHRGFAQPFRLLKSAVAHGTMAWLSDFWWPKKKVRKRRKKTRDSWGSIDLSIYPSIHPSIYLFLYIYIIYIYNICVYINTRYYQIIRGLS
jgi:hypothetical protein